MSGDTTLAKSPARAAGGLSAESGASKSAASKNKGKKKAAAKPRTKAAAKLVEQRIGHTFADPSLLATALTHVSALKSAGNRTDSYQRLEFLGDHVLGLAISDMLYRAFPKADEGELSKRLADLVRKETCVEVALTINLIDAIKLGSVGAGDGKRLRTSLLGDICESVIGAVYMDAGYAAAAAMIERLWSERMHRPLVTPRDPKTALQEWALGRGLPAPVYREIERTGPHHKPKFRIAVVLPGIDPEHGEGPNKQAAEKAAARQLLAREGVKGGSDD